MVSITFTAEVQVFSASNGPQHDLVPVVDGGLLRSVFASLQNYAKVGTSTHEWYYLWPAGIRKNMGGIWVAIRQKSKKFPLVWSFVSLWCQVNHGEILAAWPVQGFRADLVCRLPTQLLIIEVNSQQRCWIARDGKWWQVDSRDDSFPFPTKNADTSCFHECQTTKGEAIFVL